MDARPRPDLFRRATAGLLLCGVLLADAALAPSGGATGSSTATGSWAPAPQLRHPGEGAATSLETEEVLRIGRVPSGGLTAEVFDPGRGAGGAWRSVAAPKGALVEGATLLRGEARHCGNNCGKVLVQVVYDWQLYDPEKPSAPWASAAVPSFVRGIGATATRLDGPNCGQNCGKTLLVGGFRDYSPTGLKENAASERSAELYDPRADAWSLTGALTPPRLRHAAVLLQGPKCGTQCGMVLVVGGLAAPDTAVLYHPRSGNWSEAPAPAVARDQDHSATLLSDGRVLVAGGEHFGAKADMAEVYDPEAADGRGAWSPAGPCLCTPFHKPTTLLDGSVLVVNEDRAGTGTTPVELYDPSKNSWAPAQPLPDSRTGFTATLLKHSGAHCGKLLIAGGTGSVRKSDERPPLSSAWLYTPDTPPDEAACRASSSSTKRRVTDVASSDEGRSSSWPVLLGAGSVMALAVVWFAVRRRRSR